MNTTTTTPAKVPTTKRPRRFAREPQSGTAIERASSTASTRVANEGQIEPCRKNKTALLLEMLIRPEGATLHQMVEATGWLPHTTRAALTGLKKKGHDVTSAKADGVRTYRVATRVEVVDGVGIPAETEASA